MEEQLITIIIKTSRDKCVMTDDQIKEWYESHVRDLFNPAYGAPEITVMIERTIK